MTNSSFKLEESPKKKGPCPRCQHKNTFRYYEGLPRKFGRCERINSCGAHIKPTYNELKEMGHDIDSLPTNTIKKDPVKIVYPSSEQLACANNLTTPFHIFCREKLGIADDQFRSWGIGGDNQVTNFIYRNVAGKALNIVSISYINNGNNNCNRNKSISPFSLRAGFGEKYTLCLFGEHLLQDDKITCVVESEKTAFIAAAFYPQFNWLATGGANKLTDEKIEVLYNRKIFYLNDADKAGKENSTVKKMRAYKLDFEIIDLFPNRDDGYDLADAIIDGKLPEIISAATGKDEAQIPAFYKPIYKIDKETEKRIVTGCEVNYRAWTELLLSFGFRRFDLENREYVFVKIDKQVISEVTITQIQDYFIDYLTKLPEELPDGVTRDMLLDKFYKNPAHYFCESRLSLLKNDTAFSFNNDTKDTAFIYFNNGFVKVTKDGWDLCDYGQLTGYVWKDQIINRQFVVTDLGSLDGESMPYFAKFMFRISGGDMQRFDALCSIIGYNLHSYYETKLKATVLTDSSISEEAEGRTGKTLLTKCFEKVKRYVEIPGKDFDPNEKYKYSKCSLDTQIVHINDAKQYFNFEVLYNDITEGITVDKKNKHPFPIRVKIILSTNKTVKMDGASSKDRSIEFELAEHYSDKFSPKDEFGHWFFTDWDESEWNLFHNFMMHCLWTYFNKSLIQPKELNLSKRKLLDHTCAEFVEFMAGETIKFGIRYDRKELHDKFLNAYPDFKEDKYKKQLKVFTSWLIAYSEYTEGFAKVRKASDITRSNGTNWIVFTSA